MPGCRGIRERCGRRRGSCGPGQTSSTIRGRFARPPAWRRGGRLPGEGQVRIVSLECSCVKRPGATFADPGRWTELLGVRQPAVLIVVVTLSLVRGAERQGAHG